MSVQTIRDLTRAVRYYFFNPFVYQCTVPTFRQLEQDIEFTFHTDFAEVKTGQYKSIHYIQTTDGTVQEYTLYTDY